MKKNFYFVLAFLIVWGLAAGVCYLLGIVFEVNYFMDWKNNIILGFSCAAGGIFGPIVAAYIGKVFKKQS